MHPRYPPLTGPEDLEPVLEAVLDHSVGTLWTTLAPLVTLVDPGDRQDHRLGLQEHTTRYLCDTYNCS